MTRGKYSTTKHLEKILIGMNQRPMTAKEASDKFDIPISDCQRNVRILEMMGLIICIKQMHKRGGGKIKVYKVSEEKVKVVKENDRYVVKINVPLSFALDLGKFLKDLDI